MKIRMYYCDFGDCFQIDEDCAGDVSHLLVDCGCKEDTVSTVLEEIKGAGNKEDNNLSFLLTHYHTDHFSGLCKRKDNVAEENSSIKFKNIYIPDVWDCDNDVYLVALLLLSELKRERVLKTEDKLKNGGLCLIDFLISLLEIDGTCHFVKAGDVVENRYEVLWPKKDVVSQNARNDFEQLYSQIGENETDIITSLAKKLIDVVSKWDDSSLQSRREFDRNTLEWIKEQQISLLENREILGAKRKRIHLADYGNNVSIVFHSDRQCFNLPHILFTGDFPKKYWNKIREDLLENYDVVKAPHHGTQDYYWEELNNHLSDNSALMIPNGNANDKHEWYISFKYPRLLKTGIIQSIYCSGMQACPVALGNGDVCVCNPSGKCILKKPNGNGFLDHVIP